MALADSYSQLQTDIQNWADRSDTDFVNRVTDFITLAESRIYREVRIRAMEAPLSDTISSGVIAVPSDYVALKIAYVSGSPVTKLTRVDSDYIYRNYPTRSSESKPKFIAQEGGNFIFGPYPDSAYTISGIYYKRLPALSGSNTTNWFTANAPDILLFASLVESISFTGDRENLEEWEDKYQDTKRMINLEEKQERRSGGAVRTRAG